MACARGAANLQGLYVCWGKVTSSSHRSVHLCASYDPCMCVYVRVSLSTPLPFDPLECRSAALFGRFMDDIRKALPVILVCGGALSFILGLGFLVFLKLCAA